MEVPNYALQNRDPYIIHLNIALYMVVSLYFGVEKATCFKWLQNGDLLRSPAKPKGVQVQIQTNPNTPELPNYAFELLGLGDLGGGGEKRKRMEAAPRQARPLKVVSSGSGSYRNLREACGAGGLRSETEFAGLRSALTFQPFSLSPKRQRSPDFWMPADHGEPRQ